MADKGSSTAKISLVANFEQNNIKAMGKQLSDGIKASLKDIKLDTVFDDANILDGVKKEIESIDGLLKNRTLNRLDFSSMIPPLAQALEDSSLSEQIRLQIIQGFREGLESGRTFLQGMPSGMTGDEIKAQFRQSAIMSDAVNSLPGLNKNQRSAFKKQWASITENDIRQLMATMDIADEYQDVLPYLLDVENLGKMVMENITSDKAGAPQKVVAAIARLQEMADKEGGKGKQSKLLDKLFSTQVQGGTVEQVYEGLLESIPTLDDLYARVYDASVARDNARANIPKANATIENLLAKTLQRGYKNGSLQKMEPLYSGNYKTPAHITLSDLVEASNKETDTSGGEGAENAAKRAENAAERAETASEEARAVAEDMKGTVKEGTAEASGISKKSNKKSSTQTSPEPVEQIADDAEADAESAEHVADVLDDKKAHLESIIIELENKNRELQELNNKYQKAISDTFGEVKTPEEALALFKEKAAQLQQADKDFADIVPQRNFTDPSNSEEIAILEEYEKRLAALQQALVEYQKAGETAMGKGVNPTDIRANQVDEERLQLNFADSTIDGYIKGLQKAIEDNKKKISEYENLLKTYKGQLEEFTRQGSPSDAKPSGGGQTQSRPVIDTAREEAGEVRKSREELQVEREKLEAEIQNSTQLMNGAERQIADIDQKIGQAQNNQQRNEANISRLTEKKEQIESQIQQTKDELKTIKERLQDAVDAKQAAEEEIKTLEEKLSSADSDIISADFPENASRYNELKTKRDYHTFEQEGINRPILDDLKQEKQSIEDILNQSYSVKTMDEAYKQAMQRKKEYLEKRKKYAEAIKEAEKYEIGSADWMMKIADSQSISAEQDTAWIAYYKSMQEFESHGKDSKSKRTKRERLYSGMSSTEMPDEESAEIHLSDLQDYLVKLNNQIADREKLIELTQKDLDKLQQEIDELSSHVVTVDSISEQLEQKKQEQQKFEQEEANWTAQQDTKQAELDNLNEQLNGTRGIANYLKAVQEGQQNNQEELAQLQQQRAEQQRIYDEAKATQEEKARQLEELDRLIAETEARESAPPSTPAGAQERDSTQTDDIYQKTLQEFNETKTKLDRLKEERERIRSEIQNILKTALGEEHSNTVIRNEHAIPEYQKEIEEYKAQLQQLNQQQEELQAIIEEGYSTNGKRDARALLKQKKEDYENAWRAQENSLGQMTSPLEKSKASYNFDKAWIEYYKAFQEAQKKAVNEDWLKKQTIIEEDPMHFSEDVYQDRINHIQQSSQSYKQEIEKSILEEESLIEQTQNRLARLREKEQEVLSGSSEYQTLTGEKDQLDQEISQLQEALEQKRKLLKSIEQEEVETGTNIEPPLSSSGAETANGVQEEGNEAGDAAEKMQALAQAKKEALEANKQLAESANTTQKAIQNESDAGNFDELIAKLVEAAKLLAQLPQSFEGFKGFDLEPLKTLSEAIQQLPKEGLNISLGDSFDKLANNIDEVLKKVQELTSQAKIAEIESTIAEKYDEQIKQLKTDAEEAKRVIEELKKAQTIKQSSSIDEYDPTLDSTTARTRKRNVAKRISKQQTPEIDPLAKEYGLLYQAQQESFKANNIDEYNTALEKSESILQRINELEQKIFSDYGKNPYQDELLSRNYSQLLQDNSQNKNNVQASKDSIKNFIEKQNAEIENLENRVNNIQLIPEEAQTNWDQAYIDKYNSIKESAQEVTTTVQILKETLAQAGATGLDQNTLRAFLEFKQSATEQVASTQKENDTFKSNIASMSNEYINKLSEVENRLLTIKKNSEKLINIDPSIGNTLLFVEQYLSKIKDLKETVSKEPLAIYDSDVKGRIDTTISELTDKKNEEDEQTMLEQMEQVSERSQTDLDRIVNNYSRYTTALNKLFTDIAKGSKSSADELEKDFKRINDFSSKLVNATGLEQGDLLKGELKSSASPRIVDAQTEAYNKNAIAFEGMYTKIESKAESAKNKIEEIFGDMDITKSLDEKFIGGNVEGFDEFVQKATQVETVLKNLKKIQETIKTDDTWLLQKKNADELRQTIATLETSLASVSKASSNFKIVDDLDVQKLRASTKQYIRDNPALTGGEVSELNNYINQLQNKINSVDFKNIEDGIQGVQQKAQEAGHTGETFMSMLTQRFKSLGAYLLSFVSFYEVIGVFKQGIGIIHELDDALTEMNKVSTESLASLKDYQKESFGVANDVGTTAIQLQQSTADFIRLGESFQEAKESARVANELMTVSEFNNIQDATTALVSISAAYEDAANGLDKQAIVDKLNKIGDEYAISTDGLATALQDSASALTTANNDMDEAAALIAAGVTKYA